MLSKEEELRLEYIIENIATEGWRGDESDYQDHRWLIEKLNETNDELKKTNEILTAVRTDKARVVNQLKRVRTELEQVWKIFT